MPKLARWFLLAVFIFEVYRAATQSFTVDEAFLYLTWVKPGFRAILGTYDAAHHVLYTWLEWLVSKPLGYSELVLRLPSLAACAAYLVFVYRFAARLDAGPWYRLGVVILLGANPLILDHLAIARGYGLALALFAWCIDSVLNERLVAAGLLAGLSIAANLTFLFPVAALVIAVVALKPSMKLIDHFIGPAVVVAFVLLIAPVSHASQGNYYFGTPTLVDSARELLRPTFVRNFEDAGRVTGYAIAAVCLAGLIAGLVTRARSFSFRLLSMVLVLASGFTLASHWLLKFPLPEGRTGLWFMFLLLVAALDGASSMPGRTAVAACLLVLGVAQCFQLDARYYFEWKFDASTKRLVKKIRDREAPLPREFTFQAKDYLRWSVEYYALRLKMTNMTVNPTTPPDYRLIHSIDASSIPGYTRVIYDRLCDCEIGQTR